MYVLDFRGLAGACVCLAYPPSTRAARYNSSYVCLGLCIRTYVARYLVLEVPFSCLETRKCACGVGGGNQPSAFLLCSSFPLILHSKISQTFLETFGTLLQNTLTSSNDLRFPAIPAKLYQDFDEKRPLQDRTTISSRETEKKERQ